MTGIICIDKPQDFTSFDVVAKARGITGIRKMGHGGTLDPMATGVLPLFLGRATKAMDIMPIQDKRYSASFRLGIATDTQDITGRVLAEDSRAIDPASLESALTAFRGTISQIPPMYSAVQQDGKRLYDLARQGIEVERPARTVNIERLTLLGYDPATRSGELDICCSKGTYIRTIIHDIGQSLGCGGTLTDLRRTETLGYSLAQCVTLEQLQQLADTGRLAEVLLPVESAFARLPRINLTAKQATMFQNGVKLDTKRMTCPEGSNYAAVWYGDIFVGTAHIDRELEELLLEKLFYLDRSC